MNSKNQNLKCPICDSKELSLSYSKFGKSYNECSSEVVCNSCGSVMSSLRKTRWSMIVKLAKNPTLRKQVREFLNKNPKYWYEPPEVIINAVRGRS